MERLLSVSEILEKISADTERLIGLGISNERQHEYYNQLPIDCTDPEMDRRAFLKATAGLNLTPEETDFVQKVLDRSDPR